MNHRIVQAAALAAALFTAPPVNAQATAVVLTPPDPARWDVAAHVGWFGGNKSEIAPDYNDWYDSASVGVSAGYYWTPHLKLEAEVFTTNTGDIYSQEPVELPGATFPYFVSRQHHFRSTAVSGGVTYQFFENAWFHPLAGLGIEASRETVRVETPQQFIPSRVPGPPTLVMGPLTERDTRLTARPYVTAGFKWYVSPRAFVRSELRSSFSTEQVDSVTWRVGVGVDF